MKKMQEEELVYENAFHKNKLGFFGSGRWNVAPPLNPKFST
jgi:hypothetical protein